VRLDLSAALHVLEELFVGHPASKTNDR
jgi:hypothetical protein